MRERRFRVLYYRQAWLRQRQPRREREGNTGGGKHWHKTPSSLDSLTQPNVFAMHSPEQPRFADALAHATGAIDTSFSHHPSSLDSLVAFVVIPSNKSSSLQTYSGAVALLLQCLRILHDVLSPRVCVRER